MTWGRVVLALLGLAVLAAFVVLRAHVGGPPVFTIEHAIEFPGEPAEVWDVAFGDGRDAGWNPYLLALRGPLEVGASIEIAILQRNWQKTMELTQVLVEVDPPRRLAWRGQPGPSGLIRTDHSFAIEPLGSGSVRFVHREEFRGVLARFFDETMKGHTEAAFRAMDEALAERVATLRASH